MALVENHILPSATNSGTGPPINILNLSEYTKLVSPPYSGGSQPGAGDSRFAIQFISTSGEKHNPIVKEWIFADESALDAEIILINTTIGVVVAP